MSLLAGIVQFGRFLAVDQWPRALETSQMMPAQAHKLCYKATNLLVCKLQRFVRYNEINSFARLDQVSRPMEDLLFRRQECPATVESALLFGLRILCKVKERYLNHYYWWKFLLKVINLSQIQLYLSRQISLIPGFGKILID